jgi:hypothetical protein
VIFATGEFGKVVAPMSEFDPNEMVQFYGKLQSLSRVVHEIMRQPCHRRAVVNVFRVGKEPSVLGASEIEDIANCRPSRSRQTRRERRAGRLADDEYATPEAREMALEYLRAQSLSGNIMQDCIAFAA